MNSVALKRVCPFDDFSPQTKIFITEKIMNSRSTGDRIQVKAIQNKTVEKLFQGANRKNPEMSGRSNYFQCPHSLPPQQQSLNKNEAPKRYRQMQINFQGKLLVPISQENMQIDKIEPMETTIFENQKCCFCEVQLSCPICLQNCQRCQQSFCPQCCLTISQGIEDRTMCLSCVN
ncbi:uncharacterized protein LOC132201230 [Neocloeon triangulifer]|uniref:uncharacterized protein LOC132201230 n=1 Tax=Neocloeon triangulifer TaxID=2078957 RepID=UPI00286F9FFC|nr:uncharacterized protein LOC132201230 [Neocloeon triangulifer]